MALPTSYTWFISPEAATGVGALPVSGMRIIGRGKVGIAVPVSSDGRGRLALVSGETQLRKVIFMNLLDLDSANPFQGEIGLGSAMIFANNDEAVQADMRRRINALFRRLHLQDRARLGKPVQFTVDSVKQDLVADVDYINLEENRPDEVSLQFSKVGSSQIGQSFIKAVAGR